MRKVLSNNLRITNVNSNVCSGTINGIVFQRNGRLVSLRDVLLGKKRRKKRK